MVFRDANENFEFFHIAWMCCRKVRPFFEEEFNSVVRFACCARLKERKSASFEDGAVKRNTFPKVIVSKNDTTGHY